MMYLIGFFVTVIITLYARNMVTGWRLEKSKAKNSALSKKVEEQGFIIGKEKQYEAIKNKNAADPVDINERLRNKDYFER